MNACHQKILDAIIQKAEECCPDALAMIGVYGSCATGDLHARSDLDLLILLNKEEGRMLSHAFVLDDAQIGYDLYCTDWALLERDASCEHAHLSRLMDSVPLYVKDPTAPERLERLREHAGRILASDARFDRAREAMKQAKCAYGECLLANSLSSARMWAADAIFFVLDALMLFHGKYFHKGIKRCMEELRALPLSFDLPGQVGRVVSALSTEDLQEALAVLMRSASHATAAGKEKAPPSQAHLVGTYEEIYSNWRNKMWEAAETQHAFSSFMNAASFQQMGREIGMAVAISPIDIMGGFDPTDLEKNAMIFDEALEKYRMEYEKAGISPCRYATVDAFVAAYLEKE